jgi:hypothetical protein
MTDRWRGNSDVFLMEPSRWPPAENAGTIVPPFPEPDEPELSPRERYKRKLARAWMNTNQPQNFSRLPVQNTVEQIVVPAAQAWNKGAGVTPEEIESNRAAARRELAERQAKAWQSRVSHL